MIDFAPIERIGVLLLRPGALLLAAPPLGGAWVPAPVKIGLTLIIAISLAPLVRLAPIAGGELPAIILRELMLGIAVGAVLRALVAGAELGGHLVGTQLGFSYGATIDPVGGVRNTMMSSLYASLAALALFGLNAHHAILRALALSYEQIPPGEGHLNPALVGVVAETLGVVFILGLRLAAPILAVMLVVEVLLGLIAKSAPALNAMVIGYPVRLLVGMLALAACIGVVPSVISGTASNAAVLAVRLASAFK